MLVPFADPVVDWGTIGKVVGVSLVAGVGVTLAFSIAVLGATRSLEMRREQRGTEASMFAALGFFGAAVCAAAIVFGIIVMSSK